MKKLSSKIIKIPQSVIKDILNITKKVIKRLTELYSNFDFYFLLRAANKDIFLESIKFKNPYTNTVDDIPIFLYLGPSRVNAFAAFDPYGRNIVIYCRGLPEYMSGMIDYESYYIMIYNSIIHEITHAIDPRLDYRTGVGAKYLINHICNEAKVKERVRESLIQDLRFICKGVYPKGILSNFVQYWIENGMDHYVEYLCSKRKSIEKLRSYDDPMSKDRAYIEPPEIEAYMSHIIRVLDFVLLNNKGARKKQLIKQINDFILGKSNDFLTIKGAEDIQNILNIWKKYPAILKKFKKRLAYFLANRSDKEFYQSV